MQSNALIRALCRILIVCLAASSVTAQAGLIGTDQAVAGAVSFAGARDARAAIVGQLEALGVSAGSARERVAALSDAEAFRIAGRLEELPAGADPLAIFAVLLLIFLVWRFGFSDQAQAEAKAREGAAQKEAPAKK